MEVTSSNDTVQAISSPTMQFDAKKADGLPLADARISRIVRVMPNLYDKCMRVRTVQKPRRPGPDRGPDVALAVDRSQKHVAQLGKEDAVLLDQMIAYDTATDFSHLLLRIDLLLQGDLAGMPGR
ncbi:hypothetical protein YGS_C1P2764 [Sphingobium sp. YG1]|nr:hypothetical protein YGS_C1P2764 [Sphingobium sp. YG1]